MICPRCGNKEFIKAGFGYRGGGKVQKYQCKTCGRVVREPNREVVK